jgi:hypothetical protein
MARLKIGATSDACSGGHTWEPGLAQNYRVCAQCCTVQVLRDGQWDQPTGRGVRHAPATAQPTWVEQVGLSGRDLQAKRVPLAALPATRREVAPDRMPSGDEHLRAMTRRNRGDLLFQWGREHGFPQIRVQLSDRMHTIVSGSVAWRVTCDQCPLEVIEAALSQITQYREGAMPEEVPEAEREHRMQLLACGRLRGWSRFSFKVEDSTLVIGPGEGEWSRFAISGQYAHVVQACAGLAQDRVMCVVGSQPPMLLDEMRERFLAAAQRAGYPALRFRVEDELMTYKLPPNGEAGYRERALSATLVWLWNAVQALEQCCQEEQPKKWRSEEMMERARQELDDALARDRAEQGGA